MDYMRSIPQTLLDGAMGIHLEPARARGWLASLVLCAAVPSMGMCFMGDVVLVRIIVANKGSFECLGARKMSHNDWIV